MGVVKMTVVSESMSMHKSNHPICSQCGGDMETYEDGAPRSKKNSVCRKCFGEGTYNGRDDKWSNRPSNNSSSGSSD